MTVYFAFPPSQSLSSNIQTLLANLDRGATEPQYPLHTKLTMEMADEIIGHMLENLLHNMQGEGTGVLTTLVNLVKSTVHVLVKQLLGKSDNKEVARMATYLREKSLTLNGESRFGFALPDALGNEMLRIVNEINAGNHAEQRQAMAAAMVKFTDVTLERFYDDLMATLELGFIKRKAVDIARSTIAKGAHAAIGKLIPQMGRNEMQAFAKVYGTNLISV